MTSFLHGKHHIIYVCFAPASRENTGCCYWFLAVTSGAIEQDLISGYFFLMNTVVPNIWISEVLGFKWKTCPRRARASYVHLEKWLKLITPIQNRQDDGFLFSGLSEVSKSKFKVPSKKTGFEGVEIKWGAQITEPTFVNLL
ncbi:hypothetical protein PHMEG_0004285 [Phytophthora megakarya]|uniref:Uncharacterized protein n=1 Tax=Phytophthora megakarya TaxID=4795 RepID=A0A225WU36_9STRA|nr:hypothetical protein PHMEG_0004285 [Phytophthora megakarya]